MFRKIYHIILYIRISFIKTFNNFNVEYLHGDIFNYRNLLQAKRTFFRVITYETYLKRHCSSIAFNSVFKSKPTLPHGLYGIFISDKAIIGKNCVIYQQVTIGSNTIKRHPRYGAPVIGDNVIIGSGARIIGHVHIGDNCRIGAGCVVAKDMPANTTAVSETRFIHHDEVRDNTFHSINEQ